MTYRPFSSSLVSALAFVLVAGPAFAQTNAPADASATNAAPAATEPAAPAAPAPATAPAPADTTATAPAASTERPTSYTMVAGDSLDSVAKKFDTSIHALAKLNKIPKSKYKKLRTGTVLQIPPAKAETTTK
jgi:LysM repeat protein